MVLDGKRTEFSILDGKTESTILDGIWLKNGKMANWSPKKSSNSFTFIGFTVMFLQFIWENGCLELLRWKWSTFLSQNERLRSSIYLGSRRTCNKKSCYHKDGRAMCPIYEWKLYVSAKSANDCARIATLRSYYYSVVKCPIAPDCPCWASMSAWALSYLAMKLFSQNSNLCDHGTLTSQTDGRTTYNLTIALCASIAQ